MSLPQAIREDNNPFSIAGLFGLTRFFIFVRWTSYCCPHCHHVFRRDFWPNNVRLGSGERTCMNCCKVFDDGSREWPELSLAKKLRFLFPPLLIGISGALPAAAIFSVFLTPWDEHSWGLVIIIFGLSLIPVVVWGLLRLIWIFRSRHRYETRMSSMHGTSQAGGIS
jgi:hypothetical protein